MKVAIINNKQLARKELIRIVTMTGEHELAWSTSSGISAIKFCKSVRPDLIPMAYIKELEKLQDHVHPFSSSEAKSIIEQDLGKPIPEIFKKFEEVPIKSASISLLAPLFFLTEIVIVKEKIEMPLA